MGRGRVGIGKVVPPKGWRWAPPTNAYAACVGREIKSGGLKFFEATQKCKGTRNRSTGRR